MSDAAATPQAPFLKSQARQEQEIFKELADLCTSPGYAHAIAYFCSRDNIVTFGEEMTADDMRPLFSKHRLLRTEISTLIGLLVKREIDYSLQHPAKIQEYIDRTESLLEELHQAMLGEVFSALDLKEIAERGENPFDRGQALREPMFYGGE